MMADETNGGIRITTATVYNAVMALKDDVAAIGTRLEVHQQLPIHPGSAERIADHEARVRVLEKAVGLIAEQNELLGNIEKRVWALETNIAPTAERNAKDLAEIRKEHSTLRSQVEKQGRKLAWMFGAGAALLVALDLLRSFLGNF